jgi:hypothetical protein
MQFRPALNENVLMLQFMMIMFLRNQILRKMLFIYYQIQILSNGYIIQNLIIISSEEIRILLHLPEV